MDFLRASATAKLTNAATNLAAILYFTANGAVIWPAALLMAVAYSALMIGLAIHSFSQREFS